MCRTSLHGTFPRSTCCTNSASVVVGSNSRSRQLWPSSQHNRSVAARSIAPSASRLMRPTAPAILAIRGLLLVGDFSTTILTGGHVLRECSKCSYGAGFGAILMPLGTLAYLPDP